MLSAVLITCILFCSVQAIRVKRLLISAMWLALSSAVLAALLYQIGAHEAAVIELSVGAGLVSVLFVFAISISGEDGITSQLIIPQLLAFTLSIAAAVIVLANALQGTPRSNVLQIEPLLPIIFWQQRSLDAALQVVIIFVGAIAVLGLLSAARAGKMKGPSEIVHEQRVIQATPVETHPEALQEIERQLI